MGKRKRANPEDLSIEELEGHAQNISSARLSGIEDDRLTLDEMTRKAEKFRTEVYARLVAGYTKEEVSVMSSISVEEVEQVLEVMTKRTMERSTGDPKRFAAIELDRLEFLLKTLWINAMVGDLPSIDRCIKIMERRAKMLGMDTHAFKLEGTEGDLSHMSTEELKILRSLQEKALAAPTLPKR